MKQSLSDQGYEMVIGLETHVELRTATKAFCGCANQFGAPANSLCCPVCMGLAGALPVFNREALRLAAVAGAALSCEIHSESRFDRKHYFYPDLPKAYQITQFEFPLCENGHLTIQTAHGEKQINIARIHMEEDAGKLIHDPSGDTLLDLNRCGVPLIEIVTQPDIRSGEEAAAYLRKLRAVLIAAGVSDCKMNEGSLRCDVNLSLRKSGEPLGERTEIKNLNSFQSVERAIWAESQRQAAILESGNAIVRETCRFDQKSGQTVPMRRKEDSADYLYFPDPDLPPIYLTDADIEAIGSSVPLLPDARKEQFIHAYGLTPYAAEQLSHEPWLANYFERAAHVASHPMAVANLILGEVFAQITLREQGRTEERDERSLPIAPNHLARLSDMAAEGLVNSSTAKRILAALFEEDQDPEAYATRYGLFTIHDEKTLRQAAEQALSAQPAMVQAYRAGKTGVWQALMGKAMAETKGRADAIRLREFLLEALNRRDEKDECVAKDD